MQESNGRTITMETNDKESDSSIKSEDVYKILLTIPTGRVSTYGDIARALGNPLASRRIGRILNKNPNPVVVPCHRVVKADGKIGGYALGIDKKKKLLENEGLFFKDLTIDEFEKKRFRPKIT
ncbi:MAG: MGMT family protein [Candidatus Nitrosocosmicus sp.]|jgi:methylated-DNA-[protein]-cysteine S-methyltransferase|uniref:MGMT family protein n=1 Tax=Candidatus Nitrosocosmicus agrestis TaxID=2563600 RepID=UPI0019175E5A|nr:MGMT family protein [Candidatus Nitrosocosmicus sp. SS]